MAIRPPSAEMRRRARRPLVLLIAALVLGACTVPGAWTVQAVPDPDLPGPRAVASVGDLSCADESSCLMVFQQELRSWDGATWRTVATPFPIVDETVECAAPDRCLVVRANGEVHEYDGQSFRLVDWLFSHRVEATCTSPTWCLVAGYEVPQYAARAWRWTGAGLERLPDPPISAQVADCPAPDRCTIVQGDRTARWDGATWTVDDLPFDLGYYPRLSCATADDCVVVHNVVEGNTVQIADWDGTRWTARTSVLVGGPAFRVSAIDCAAPDDCVLVANIDGRTVDRPGMTLHDDGAVVHTVAASPSSGSGLLECETASACIYADSLYTPTAPVHRWDGSAWAPVHPIVDVNPSSASLHDVVCDAPDRCVATGLVTTEQGAQLLLRTWDGTTWSRPAGVRDGTGDVLYGAPQLACATPTTCFLSGSLRRWDGTTISPVGAGEWFNTVTCWSATGCLAARAERAERWDGSTWSTIPWTLPFGTSSVSTAACTATGQCLVIAGLRAGSGRSTPDLQRVTETGTERVTLPAGAGLPQRITCVGDGCVITTDSNGAVGTVLFDGTSYTLVPPTEGGPTSVESLSCTSTSRCTALARFGASTGSATWDGTRWAMGPAAPAGHGWNAVDCVDDVCQFVGFRADGRERRVAAASLPVGP